LVPSAVVLVVSTMGCSAVSIDQWMRLPWGQDPLDDPTVEGARAGMSLLP